MYDRDDDKSYVRPAILYGSEARCLKKSMMAIFQWAQRSMVGAMCGIQIKDGKRGKDLMLIFGLNEAT